jgi:hypothetical protein
MNRTFTFSALAVATVGLTANAMAISTFTDRATFNSQLPIIMNEDFELDPEREVLDNDALLSAIGVGSTSPVDNRTREGGSNGDVVTGETRLFVDQLATESVYTGITLPGGDIGTNPELDNEVLRPAYVVDGSPLADGRFEYGKVIFEDFGSDIRGFGMDLIDVEKAPGTVVTVNLMSGMEYIIPAGADDEAQFFGFTTSISDPIQSVVVDLGFLAEDGRPQNGDGVVIDNVTTGAVPEPTTMAALGLGAMALLRRRNRNK